jgi:hypothetical protein
VCLHLDEPVGRAELRRLVAERHRALADAGLWRGGSVAMCLAPSLAFIANRLASWQIGAQEACPQTTPFSATSGRADQRLQSPPQPVRTSAVRLSCRTASPERKPQHDR